MKNKLTNLLPFLLVLAGFVMVFSGIQTSKVREQHHDQQITQITSENLTYLKAMTCMASVPAADKTKDFIKGCYDAAENETHTRITRYADGY